MSDTQFYKDRLTKTDALIVIYEAAIDALGLDGAQNYKLDTGQTITTVTKFDLLNLNTVLESLYNRHATLSARISGCGQFIGRPGF